MKNSMFLLPLAGLLALVGVAVWAFLHLETFRRLPAN